MFLFLSGFSTSSKVLFQVYSRVYRWQEKMPLTSWLKSRDITVRFGGGGRAYKQRHVRVLFVRPQCRITTRALLSPSLKPNCLVTLTFATRPITNFCFNAGHFNRYASYFTPLSFFTSSCSFLAIANSVANDKPCEPAKTTTHRVRPSLSGTKLQLNIISSSSS